MATIAERLFRLSKSPTDAKSLKQIQTLHQKSISFGLQNDTSLSRNLISLYISCGAHHSAKSVFQTAQNPSDITLWNGMIAAYTKNSMFSEAFSLYEALLQSPCLKPDSYTFPSLLKACGGLRRVNHTEKIHTRLIKHGFLSDVVIASSLTGAYAKCGAFGSAVKLFDEMPHRDLACWNNVVSCYHQSGQWEKALEYFDAMRSAGFTPDSVSFTTAISACSRLSDLERGRRIHKEISSSGLLMDAYVSATLVDMYGKCGCLNEAKEVFYSIKNKSLVSWNSMIGSYSQTGDSKSCIDLLTRMTKERVKPSSNTVCTLLAACAKSARLQHGKFVHGYITRNGLFSDKFVEISLLDFYFKCGNVRVAEMVFGKMKPKADVVAWNVMVSGYVSAGCYFEALETYDDMISAGVKPDHITITSSLSACSQLTALERGREFHDYIKENNRLNSNEVVMGALLDMYSKCGAVKEAVSVFNQLPTRDLVSWTSMIVAYGSNGKALDALKVFNEMLQTNIRPDRVTFLAVISACGHAGLVEKGQSFFNLMVDEYKIRPTIAEYSCLVDLLCRAGKLHEAYEILQRNSAVKEDAELLSMLLSGCYLRKEFILGEKVASILVEKVPDDPSSYVVLEKMYAANKKWDEARRVRSRMKELGLRKNPGQSWIEVDKKIQSFLADDKMFEEVKSVYDCLSIIYSHMEEEEDEIVCCN